MCTECVTYTGPRGLSARAIAFEGHTDHPHDVGDLMRCVAYCRGHGITTEALRARMAGRSPHWDALLPEWERLVILLDAESEDGDRAPLTYRAIRRVLSAVTP